MNKSVYFWVSTSNPINSIYIQIKYVSEILKEAFDIIPIIINPDTNNLDVVFKNINDHKELVFWHYGGYDNYLRKINKKSENLVLVYHNITPARYFLKTEPLVSIRSLIGKIQLLLLNKQIQWITMSAFNKKELHSLGFNNVLICPNIIKLSSSEFYSKTTVPSLLYVGRIAQNKNCISLLKQINLLSSVYNEKIILTIIGAAKVGSYYEKKVIKEIKKMSINTNIDLILKKNIDQNTLSEIYKESWLYISMSLHEGFGVPVCESILNGTPAIYLESGGQESILDNIGKISKKDANNFYKYIEDLILSKRKRDMLLDKQFSIAKKFLSPEVNDIVYRTYQRFFNEK